MKGNTEAPQEFAKATIQPLARQHVEDLQEIRYTGGAAHSFEYLLQGAEIPRVVAIPKPLEVPEYQVLVEVYVEDEILREGDTAALMGAVVDEGVEVSASRSLRQGQCVKVVDEGVEVSDTAMDDSIGSS